LVGNVLGGWEFRFVQIKDLVLFGAQKGAKMRKLLINLKNLLLMNHWPECIAILYGESVK